MYSEYNRHIIITHLRNAFKICTVQILQYLLTHVGVVFCRKPAARRVSAQHSARRKGRTSRWVPTLFYIHVRAIKIFSTENNWHWYVCITSNSNCEEASVNRQMFINAIMRIYVLYSHRFIRAPISAASKFLGCCLSHVRTACLKSLSSSAIWVPARLLFNDANNVRSGLYE